MQEATRLRARDKRCGSAGWTVDEDEAMMYVDTFGFMNE